MFKDYRLVLWKDDKTGFQFGYTKSDKDDKIVEELDSIEDAIKAQRFYNYLIINNYGRLNLPRPPKVN